MSYRGPLSILERLRQKPLPSLNRIVQDRKDAADEIERLRAQPQTTRSAELSTCLRETREQLIRVRDAVAASGALNNRDKYLNLGIDTNKAIDRAWETFNFGSDAPQPPQGVRELALELEKRARILNAIKLRIDISNDWRLSEDEHEQLAKTYSVLIVCARNLSEGKPGGWQPIETAPKDTSIILGWCDQEIELDLVGEGYWDGGIEGAPDQPDVPAGWCIPSLGYFNTDKPTHWLHLPKLGAVTRPEYSPTENKGE